MLSQLPVEIHSPFATPSLPLLPPLWVSLLTLARVNPHDMLVSLLACSSGVAVRDAIKLALGVVIAWGRCRSNCCCSGPASTPSNSLSPLHSFPSPLGELPTKPSLQGAWHALHAVLEVEDVHNLAGRPAQLCAAQTSADPAHGRVFFWVLFLLCFNRNYTLALALGKI